MKYLVLFISIIFIGCGGDGGGGGGNSGNPGSKVQKVFKIPLSLNHISIGRNHGCALTTEGGIQCWGKGEDGKLGNRSTDDQSVPAPVLEATGTDPLTGILQVVAGDKHTCALTETGGVLCSGDHDDYGQLGGSTTHIGLGVAHLIGVSVYKLGAVDNRALLSDIVQISTRQNHTCALTNTGGVKCWGSNSEGQLGSNEDTASAQYAVDVVDGEDSTTPLSGIAQISAGERHTCAVTVEGTVKCWGYNAEGGPLGNGEGLYTGERPSVVGRPGKTNYPVDVVEKEGSTAPLRGIVQVVTGSHHSCARTMAGTVKCWGNNNVGQLGNGGTVSANTPVDVLAGEDTLLTGIIQISAGRFHTCGITMGGGVKCWGYGLNGRLGHGDTSDAHYPVDVVERAGSSSPLTGIVSVSGGREQTCALTHRGEILCWGKGDDGQLGDNATDDQLAPVKVVSDASGTPLHTGGVWRRRYVCLKEDGTCEAEPGSLVRPLLTGSRSDTSPTPEVKVLGLEEGADVTLHTEGSCSTDSIGSGTVATGESSVTITPDTDLVARENRIYVKVGEDCSLSGVDYTFENGSDRIGGKSSSDEHAPTLTANFLADGDAISLHSSPDCSDVAVVSGTAGGTSEALSLPDRIGKPRSPHFLPQAERHLPPPGV